MSYRLSQKAAEDIVNIFIAGAQRFGLDQAERYHDRLVRLFDFLAENPAAGRQRFELTPPVRIYPVEAHLIIYMVDTKGDILIIRVRHAHEDWLGEGVGE
ncbi:type II toxin-antitoxin system RelE/ParE family toxin [Marinobacterium sp. D7]|uniref:type II toxin-antitoxin system RelE/ParE family toxin n=1 Tax=Marinobacterium ramblicola TaxID=2849041 RepID=UPI001C2CE9F1|nr:type II toxin-antitoxin system RelE/ParE family toxin [Marinobacterium ramblicola]